jgi:hypothetical protein
MLERRFGKRACPRKADGLGEDRRILWMTFCFQPKIEIYQGRRVQELETARMVCRYYDREMSHDHA